MDVAIKQARQSWVAEARCGALSSTQLPATLKAGVAGVGWEENQEKKGRFSAHLLICCWFKETEACSAPGPKCRVPSAWLRRSNSQPDKFSSVGSELRARWTGWFEKLILL